MTENGFVKPTLDEIVAEKQQTYKDTFGNDFKFDNTNTKWQDALIEAEREYQVWLQLDAVYQSRTLNGSEGTYKDDALGLQGIFRDTPKAGNGYAVIESDNTVLNTDTIDETYTFTNKDGVLYRPTTTLSFKSLSEGVLIKASDFTPTPTDYTFTVVRNGIEFDTVGIGITDTNVTTFFSNISTLIQAFSDNTIGVDIFIDNAGTSEETLRVGYNEQEEPVGITDPVSMWIDSEVGKKLSSFFVVATQTGLFNTGVGDIQSVNPTSSGFSQITNLREFYSGAGTETDAQYMIRYQQQIERANASSYLAVFNTVRDVEGVTSVRIYDNPNPFPLVDPDVIELAFKVLVNGGSTPDIAEAIELSKPINTRTDGDVTYTVITADGGSEDIKFSRADVNDITIEITYEPTSGFPLTTSEKDAINAAIVEVGGTLDIGSTVFNAQIVAAIFATVPFNYFTDLRVNIESQGDGANYVPPFDEIPNIVDTNITYTVV